MKYDDKHKFEKRFLGSPKSSERNLDNFVDEKT